MALNSAAEFFQLPKQLFTNNHKALGARDQADTAEDVNNNMIVANADGVEEVNKEEIKITKDKDICNISFKKTDNPYRYMSVLTGNLKNHESTFHLVWKIHKQMPLISVHRYKDKVRPTETERVFFEVEYANEYVFPCNYISQFTIQGKDYIVVSRLLTSKFAIVSLESEPMKCYYYGLD